ncbi:MAG: ABC transporter permease [Nocardia sp.]|nr:ABC transporter permease [Nocardia sp.]
MSNRHAPGGPGGPWSIVARREIAVKVRDRNFIMSTVFTIAAIALSLAVSTIVGSHTDTMKIAVTGQDAQQLVAAADHIAAAKDAKTRMTAHPATDIAAVEQAVRSGSADAGLVPDPPTGWRLIGKSSRNNDLDTAVGTAAAQLAMQRNAAAAGTTIEQLRSGGAVTYDLLGPATKDSGLAKVVAYVFGLLFYMSSLLFGMSIAQSVVAEKQNRIVEILASAIPVRQLLIGKVAGNTALALAQLVLFVAAGLIGLNVSGHGGDITRIVGAAGWFIVFFLVGFLALASLWAVAGALASRTEDLQSTSMPLTTILVIVLFGGMFLSGVARTVASYVPIASVVVMPARMAAGSAAWWEPMLSLLITFVTACAIVVTAEIVYRRSLMQTHGRITLRQALASED